MYQHEAQCQLIWPLIFGAGCKPAKDTSNANTPRNPIGGSASARPYRNSRGANGTELTKYFDFLSIYNIAQNI
jgi:hypothetical protein